MEIENLEQDTQLEREEREQEILLSPEFYGDIGDGKLTIQKNGTDIGTFSANQKDDTTVNVTVPVSTSELNNDANFQNANDLSNAISNHNQSTSAHQDIRQAISDEATTRLNADNSLQGQIDAITSASDVVDIVGTYAELQAYDTQHLKDNDVVKVLQDETHNDAMTYWRWSTHTQTWTYIGAEGPYYTKSETNTLLDEKLDADEVPDGFFDGPATITPTDGTIVEIKGGLKLKSISLKGNTTQQSDPAPTPSNPQTINVVTGTQTIQVAGKNLLNPALFDGITAGSSGGYVTTAYYTTTTEVTFNLEPSTNYTLSLRDIDGNLSGTAYSLAVNGTWRSLGNGYTVIQTDNVGQFSLKLGASSYGNVGSSERFIQLEKGSTATAYVPYQAQTYSIDLGVIELCKIDNKQDYIYKSGDDWYIHKETGKYTFNGSETISYNSSNHGFIVNAANAAIYFVGIADAPLYGFSSHFEVNSTTSTWTGDNTIGLSSANIFWCKATSFANSLQDCTTWLTNNKPSIYYTLASATDNKITDQILISQLNSLLNATLYQNTTMICNGSLPAILSVNAFTNNLNSILEISAEPENNVFTGTNGVIAGTAGLVPAPTASDDDKYLKSDGTWATVSGGGSITPVQTTGTSQTDVMSQNAVSSMVFADPGTDTKIKIGSGATLSAQNYNIAIGYNASVNGVGGMSLGYGAGGRAYGVALGASAKAGNTSSQTSAIAIGYNAQALGQGAIAIGRGSTASGTGVMNIGASDTSYGYNSSNYRLLSGVYDGQGSHDAVTVGQVNDTIDAINTALGTSIPHIGA